MQILAQKVSPLCSPKLGVLPVHIVSVVNRDWCQLLVILSQRNLSLDVTLRTLEHHNTFMTQEPELAVEAAIVPTQGTISAEYAVTGNDDCNRILPISACDGAYS